MKDYINYVELNEGYNPTQTFKSYVQTNFEEHEISEMIPKIRQSFIERIIQQPKEMRHENEGIAPEMTSIDMLTAMSIFVKDYEQADIFIQFITSIMGSGMDYLENAPDVADNLTEHGQQIYRLLQLIGEDVFYELLVRELDTIDSVNQDNVEPKMGVSVIDGMSKRRAQTFMYRNCVPQTAGLWNDEAWNGVRAFFKALDGYNIELYILDTNYYNFPYDATIHTGLPYKEWRFEIPFTNDKGRPTKFFGTIRGSGAGSVEDPLDKYDVTVIIS